MLHRSAILGILALLIGYSQVAFSQTNPIPNYFEVSKHLSRAAQPTRSQFLALERNGICTVISLRNVKGDARKLKGSDVRYIRVKVNTWRMSKVDIVEALTAIQSSQCPVLVHCRHGADRTGAVVAAYRICYQDWTVDEAIREFTSPRFGFHQRFFGNLIQLIRSLDPAEVRSEVARLIDSR